MKDALMIDTFSYNYRYFNMQVLVCKHVYEFELVCENRVASLI